MTHDNIITETLEDGTEITIDLDLCNGIADNIMEKIFELDEEVELEHYDAVATCFGLFINTYHVLLSTGWSVDDLKKELDEHYISLKKSMN
jgi:hypothetical protein